jgi:hypothetical protein
VTEEHLRWHLGGLLDELAADGLSLIGSFFLERFVLCDILLASRILFPEDSLDLMTVKSRLAGLIEGGSPVQTSWSSSGHPWWRMLSVSSMGAWQWVQF